MTQEEFFKLLRGIPAHNVTKLCNKASTGVDWSQCSRASIWESLERGTISKSRPSKIVLPGNCTFDFGVLKEVVRSYRFGEKPYKTRGPNDKRPALTEIESVLVGLEKLRADIDSLIKKVRGGE